MNVLSFADGRILSVLPEIPKRQVCRGGAISGGAAQQQIAAVRRPQQRVDSGEPVINKGFQNWNYLVLNMIDYLDGRECVSAF